MKLVTYLHDDSQDIGVLMPTDEQKIVILQAGIEAMEGNSSPFFHDMLSFLRGGKEARDKAQAVVEYVTTQQPAQATIAQSSVTLLAPVPRPESIRDCMAFEQHIINIIRRIGLKKLAPVDQWLENKFGRQRSLAYRFNKAWYERPIYYKSNRFSVIGTEAEVQMPSYTERFDYELEWGVFIGKQGSNISKEEAHEYIGSLSLMTSRPAIYSSKSRVGVWDPPKAKILTRAMR